MSTYTLKIKTHRGTYFRYETALFNEKGREVATSYFQTIWGCKRWGRKAAKRHAAASKSYTFEVRA